MKIIKPAGILLLLSPMLIAAQQKPDALVLYANGYYQEAIDICRQELVEKPYNTDSHSVLGWALLKLGEYGAALQQARTALAFAGSDPRILEIEAEALFFLGQIESSLERFEMYAALAPNGDRIESVYYFMGECFISLNEYDNADIAFSAAVYRFENSALWWTRLGYAREMGGEYAWSRAAYEKALRLNPTQQEALRGMQRVDQHLRGE